MDGTETVFRVPAALYTILAVYNLLPIASLRMTMLIGGTVGVVHLVASLLLFQMKMPNRVDLDVSAIAADGVFYLTANAVGIFTKCLNEVTLRRAFLDKRKCIETTIKLEYEKNQEEQLTLSILPKHIAQEIGTDLRQVFQLMNSQRPSDVSRKQQFEYILNLARFFSKMDF